MKSMRSWLIRSPMLSYIERLGFPEAEQCSWLSFSSGPCRRRCRIPSTTHKSVVAVRRDRVDPLYVCRQARHVWHEHPRFPRDVGAEVPGVAAGCRPHGGCGGLVDVL